MRYRLYESGYHYDTIEADSLNEALEEAAANVEPSNYEASKSTLWIEVRAVPENEEYGQSSTVVIDPKEPKCTEERHTWHEVGLHGNGGGVVITEQCKHCAARRVTDTWATNPDNGQSGFTSVSYPSADNS